MTRFYSPTHSNADWDPCVGAIIEISPALAGKLLTRKKLFDDAKKADSELVEMYFWSGAVDWAGDGSDDDGPTCDPIDEQIAEQAQIKVPGDQVTRIPAHVQLKINTMRSECDQCIVDEGGVFWMTYPKHMDAEIRTQKIDWDTITEASIV